MVAGHLLDVLAGRGVCGRHGVHVLVFAFRITVTEISMYNDVKDKVKRMLLPCIYVE